MKWLQSPENQVKRDSDISWDSHGKKNAETAWCPLTFEQMLENLVSCLHGTGLLIPLPHYPTVSSPVWLSSYSSSCANMLCLQGSGWFSELLQVPWGLLLLEWQPWLRVFSQIPAGGWTILRPTGCLDHVVPVNPSRPLSFMNVMDGTPAYPIIEPVPCPVPEYTPALDWQFLIGPHYWWATLEPSSTGLYSVENEDLHDFNGSESQYALFSETAQGSFATVTPQHWVRLKLSLAPLSSPIWLGARSPGCSAAPRTTRLWWPFFESQQDSYGSLLLRWHPGF